jgi:predicted TIM-barrel fold metal-dependent hydrolase
MDWTVDVARPWIQTLIDLFGPDRCMLGSHLPIARLPRGFELLYDAYEELLADLSPGEQDSLFRGTATAWFGLDRLGLAVGDGGAARNGTHRRGSGGHSD